MLAPSRRDLFHLETLEPRLLLSADGVVDASVAAQDDASDELVAVSFPIEENTAINSGTLTYDRPSDSLDDIFAGLEEVSDQRSLGAVTRDGDG